MGNKHKQSFFSLGLNIIALPYGIITRLIFTCSNELIKNGEKN